MKYKDVGRKIKDYRQKSEMTQQELADKIGVTWEMVSRYERGLSSPFSRIDRISEVFNIPSHQLLQKDNNASEYKFYEVPLFTSLPESKMFLPSETKLFYSAPKWIHEIGVTVFAVESKLIKNSTIDIRDNGIVYVSSKVISDKGIYLNIENGSFRFTDRSDGAVGQVLAQEIRYI
ncbi:helix-turn-helix transcriptional regulator [Candidatus Dojkabacteria bacterium]|nr:helix-turn-helix transcriptional regulator [Candidatus Dojkabacteria bacterium]